MDKQSHINISMNEETQVVDFSCEGDFESVSYLAFEVLNKLKKHLCESGFTDEEARAFLMDGAKFALTTFE